VTIALTYAALNGLEVCAADIQNAYLHSPSSYKDYIICGPEFGVENEGKVALIHRAIYGGKSAGRDFRNHLRSCMYHLGFKSYPADPDVWMRNAIKSAGMNVYEYVLLYKDVSLSI
jgi:Reverse transcriptase (RNA-dependent DNA polymerase)